MINSLLKGVILLAFAGLAAYGVILILNSPGNVKITLDNKEINISILIGLLTVISCFIIFWMSFYVFGVVLSLIRFLLGDDTAITRYFSRARKSKGYEELSKALVLLYEGNNNGALFHSRRAKKLLNNNKLSILVNTQIAHQTGDSKLALENYKHLLTEKDTRLVAISGIVSEKIKAGDITEALTLAKKAFELSPKNSNTLMTLFNLQIHESDWVGAQKTLQFKRKLEKIPRDLFLRQEAILIFAEAREKRALGHTKEALNETLVAVRQYPDFVVALSFLTELEVLSGNRKRVEKLLKKAWLLFPHPDIATAYASLVPDEGATERLKRFEVFTKVKTGNSQVAILNAELHMAAKDFLSAKQVISEVVERDPDNRVLTLMALIERGCGATDEVIRSWLTKAVYAPKAPNWICKACGTQVDWDPICSECDGFDTIRWQRPPLYREDIDRTRLLPLIMESDKANEEKREEKKDNQSLPKSDKTRSKERKNDVIENMTVKNAREIN